MSFNIEYKHDIFHIKIENKYRNALTLDDVVEFDKLIREFDVSSAKVAIISGTQKYFCTGMSLNHGGKFWKALPNLQGVTTKPILGAVEGWCVGGGLVLAGMCDYVLASSEARFSYPEGKLGYTGGLLTALSGILSTRQLLEICVLGGPFRAEDALRLGIVNKVVRSEALYSEIEMVAEALCAQAPLVFRAIKEMLLAERSGRSRITAHIEIERTLDRVLESEACRLGIENAREKISQS